MIVDIGSKVDASCEVKRDASSDLGCFDAPDVGLHLSFFLYGGDQGAYLFTFGLAISIDYSFICEVTFLGDIPATHSKSDGAGVDCFCLCK